jgi:tetratricopeptide (TPR) repeat protein
MGAWLGLLFATAAIGHDVGKKPAALRSMPAHLGPVGPEETAIDLLRDQPGGPRIYVQATLPDGELGLFMVDTGADISVLSKTTAERIGLEVEQNYGEVWGLGGTQPMHRAVIPKLQLGEMEVDDIEVAVGVRGVGEEVAFMPIDGILGNNVWSHFTVELDYPADLMVLHDPNQKHSTPRHGAPLVYNGAHLFTPALVVADGKPAAASRIEAQLDTGAGGVILCGDAGKPFSGLATEGLDAMLGVGASETMPPYELMRTTRRVPLSTLVLGGRSQPVEPLYAKWIGYTDDTRKDCAFQGLIGHELFAPWRVWFDYTHGWFSLEKSHRKRRQLDGHAVLLEQEIAAHGEDPSRALYRAKLLIGEGDIDSAKPLLATYVGTANGDASEARVLLANVDRATGDLAGAWTALEGIPAGDLVDQGEIVQSVNGLLLDGKEADAMALAQAGVAERPDDGWAHVAESDALLYQGKAEGANEALRKAAELADYPDAHLLRRARVALATGDRFGAMADLRRLIDLYPAYGLYIWFYAMLVETPEERDTFRVDLKNAMDRLHPDTRPLDFLVAGYTALGDHDAAAQAMDEGLARDCGPIPEGPDRDNCLAWYWGLAGVHLDEAKDRITSALAKSGDRSDFLDTEAMVWLARGDLESAAEAARKAARLSPEDVYMLWQAERLRQMADEKKGGS